jgi:hypothetical protein
MSVIRGWEPTVYCPQCDFPSVRREDGMDTCQLGHTYPSGDALKEEPSVWEKNSIWPGLILLVVMAVGATVWGWHVGHQSSGPTITIIQPTEVSQ